MALTLERIGRYKTSPEADYGEIGANNSRASVYDAVSKTYWIKGGGFIGGKSGSSAPSVVISVYDPDASNNPDARICYMSGVTASTSDAGAGGGATYTAAISHSDNGPSNKGALIYSGKSFAIDLLSKSYSLGHSMREAAAITADNEQFYNRTAPGSTPPDPYGSYSASVEGQITAWLEVYANQAPLAPSSGLAPSGTVNDLVPTFTADFQDLNGAYGTSHSGYDSGDILNQYRIVVERVSDGTVMWNNLFNANSAEQAANAVSRTYLGSTLTRGVTYRWKIQMSDAADAWSDYSAWTTFTVASLGYVTLDGAPSGNVDAVTGITFYGKWTHASSEDMTHVQARILNSAGTVLQTGSIYDIVDVSSSASPGTSFSIAWAHTGFSDLAWGTTYKYQMRGEDEDGNWSDWSSARSFSTDKAPTIPSALSPNGTSTPITAYPTLACSFSDADDTSGGTLTGVIRITRPDATTVDVTPTYNATTGKWEKLLTATECNQYGVFSWKATGYDGTLYSGEATTLGAASWSSSATFDYETGPTVSIDSPSDTDTISTSSLAVSWTASAQAQKRVLLYADGTSDIVYDSGWVVDTTQSATIPSGSYLNETDYDLVVSVKDGSGLVGTSSIVNISISYTPPDPVTGVQIATIRFGNDAADTAMRITWEQTGYSTPDWQRTVIRMQADAGPDTTQVIIAELTSPSDTAFVYENPASGATYTFGVSQVILDGVDELESDPTEVSASIALDGLVLTLLGDEENSRVYLTNVRQFDQSPQFSEAVYAPLSGRNPTTVAMPTDYLVTQWEAAVIDKNGITAATRKAEFDALKSALRSGGGTLCVRDWEGSKFYAKLSDYKPSKQQPNWWSISFQTREEYAVEGIST